MTIRSDQAWRKAAACAVLANQAGSEISRGALIRMRNSWITIANDAEVLGAVDSDALLSLQPDEAA